MKTAAEFKKEALHAIGFLMQTLDTRIRESEDTLQWKGAPTEELIERWNVANRCWTEVNQIPTED